MPYIYKADVWCDSCAEHIMEEIRREHPELVPADPDDEYTFDSDDWPKCYLADQDESDSPQNCASGNCAGTYGTFLENRLFGAFDGGKGVKNGANRKPWINHTIPSAG